jgi:glycosyltransferase involved in cell wall biosynthesis
MQWQIDKCFVEAGFNFLYKGSHGDRYDRLEGSPRLLLLAKLINLLSTLQDELKGQIFVAVCEKNNMQKIAVITRTKNRNLLLNRCLDSLLKQTYKGIEWVIVNDNGEVQEVEAVAQRARDSGLVTKVINRSASTGISAAANNGITESESELIHIHDDDDTVEPDFYRSIVSYLDEKPCYMGVVTCTSRVDEKIVDDKVKFIDKSDYCKLDGSIYISDLIWKNQFTTVSFVYRRAALNVVGLFDESLPVLEDWDFNIRFIEKYDIGVIPKFLANYHWRLPSSNGGMTQTVTSGSCLHQEYTAVVRNKMLRRDLVGGKVSLGMLMTLGRTQQLQSNKLKIIDDKVEAGLFLRRLTKRLILRLLRRQDNNN